jgi:anti-sigma factor RsiW
MNCAEFEIVLADYLDGTLQPEGRAAVEQHVAACAGCRELLNDAAGAFTFLKRADEVVPPSELITRIAHQAPLGRTRQPFERQGALSRLASKWLQPILQPRPVMGMAMTVLSFAMLERCTGVRVQQIQAADLSPIRIWGGVEDKAVRLKDRGVKYYENLRWVYEIETRLKSLQDQQEALADQEKTPADHSHQHTTANDRGASTPDRERDHK